MTEADWLAATHPHVMLEQLGSSASERKLRLFAAACCRLTFESSTRSRHAEEKVRVELAERIAEGESPPSDPLTYHFEFHTIFHDFGSSLEWACHAATCSDAWEATSEVVMHLGAYEWKSGKDNIGVKAARCIFGNPFRPVAFDARWRSETAVALATGIYTDLAFDRLPVLADALEEVGCDAVEVLSHLRGPGPHARGCWVVDEVLGKS